MFFDSTTGVTTHTLSNQAVMNFRDLRNIEAAFFIPACFALLLHRVLLSTVQGQVAPQTITTNQNFLF